MSTYLFTWNQKRWPWTYLQDSINDVKSKGYCKERWSCGVTTRIQPGDRAFLIKLGREPRGLVASGWVESEFYEALHWDNNKASKGATALYVDVEWDTILDSEKELFPFIWLKSNKYSTMHWASQTSGIRIPDDMAEQLEIDWATFLERPILTRATFFEENLDNIQDLIEGATQKITVNSYERNNKARTICINFYGINCYVCGFNFENFYGEIGRGYIHVHHLKPLSEINNTYQINPIKDLRPVCPNCHAMLHQRRPGFSIDELKTFLRKEK